MSTTSGPFRASLLSTVSLCLCVYFCWHISFGERSYFKYKELSYNINLQSQEYDRLHAARTTLEDKVVRLRPGSIDPDLLEERAKMTLGYIAPGEKVIILSGQNS